MNDDLAACHDAHARLLARVDGLGDDEARRPSLLPGWTVGHVLTHLARNADGFVAMFEGRPMYASFEARAGDIEAGSGRSAEALVDDVRASAARLEAAFAAATPDVWAGEGTTLTGPVALRELPGRRRREVEVHHLDLGLGGNFSDWPADFVRVELSRMQMLWASRRPMGMTQLPDAALAASPEVRLAWLFGRTTIEGLEPAGIF